jgi:hypothetical protein
MNLTRESLLERVEHHTELGHAKRDAAFVRQVSLACSCPVTSLAQAAGQASNSAMADLMSLYRFVDNDKASISQLREIRSAVVLESISAEEELLIVHDVTQLDYSRQNVRADRRLIGDHRGQGYEYFPCVAVQSGSGRVVGVVHDTIVNKDGPDDRDVMDYNYEPLFADFSRKEKKRLRDNHRHQMAVHVQGLAKRLEGRRVIHVADCEFDDVFILDRCVDNQTHFVIRSSAARNVQIPNHAWIPPQTLASQQSGHPAADGWVCVNLQRLIDHVPVQPYKVLPLDSRSRVTDAASAARLANLSVGACRLRLYRDAKRNQRYFRPPRPVDVSMVVIRELDVPLSGEDPLCWVLLTTLPVDTFEQMAHVGRIYELRWKIEDFFRLLKSGYHIESCRMDSADKIAKLLVALTLASMVVVNLKAAVGLPAAGRLSPTNYLRIKNAMTQLNNPEIDLHLRLFAFVAKRGGWRARKTDPIGPAVLMRGILVVLSTFDAIAHYSSLLDEARRHPQSLENLFAYTC